MKKVLAIIIMLFVISIDNVHALNLTTKEEREVYEKYMNSRQGMIELEELIIPVIFISGCMVVANLELRGSKKNEKTKK